MSFLLKLTSMDVTNEVVGKLGEEEVRLFYENEQIGRLNLTNRRFELKTGYHEKSGRIFKHVTVTASPDEKYVDCDDERGWC
ncbi:uncharacterized protein DUF2553 [Thermolongibacillus altinsuensis]|uniref:Uncharacterized protein DUF2553 n=1 Tax=Thermolongibacillus altinsuensis TaxID=575256 RepID=A0A4R1QC99_9BACL|nr:YusG family protein [Thermolongibacillus altinsuensis]TCL47368.1 uncharacterized protein DUF2553 [Thermolongibacillus altinsuensis]